MAKDRENYYAIPPQDLDAERAVIGSILIRPGAMNELVTKVTHFMFYHEKHRNIYKLMLELYNQGEAIDIITLSSKAKEKNIDEKIGGSRYLTELTREVPSSANVHHYASIVEKKHIQRRLIEAAQDISTIASENAADDIENILNKAESKIFEITQGVNKSKYVTLKEALRETWEELEHLHEHKDELRGIPTGFKELDNMLAGLQRSDLVILAARPSVGKTTLALDIARQTSIHFGSAVGVFSLEMSASQLTQRMLAAESQVSAWNLRTGNISSDKDFQIIGEALDRLAKAKIYIDDMAANNIVSMRSTARRWKSEHGLDLIIVDYLQLMASTKDHDSMVNQVTEISRSLKQLARELNVPVLALSQLSRAVESRGGKPRLSDLRDSGSIEQDADVVMFLHREDKYKDESEKTNIVQVLIEKHRNGPTGVVNLFFDQKKTTYLSIDKTTDEAMSYSSIAGQSLDDF
ncbi:replicative DNA helicase [Candidatus Nomurabacteria bacterium]|nr:replicative DNA helicase [Candidatus Nomurabacteria bacterium]USN94942.1 MAG: replicative DNA helicase [Candidatus Nomurabacteria bacterium]